MRNIERRTFIAALAALAASGIVGHELGKLNIPVAESEDEKILLKKRIDSLEGQLTVLNNKLANSEMVKNEAIKIAKESLSRVPNIVVKRAGSDPEEHPIMVAFYNVDPLTVCDPRRAVEVVEGVYDNQPAITSFERPNEEAAKKLELLSGELHILPLPKRQLPDAFAQEV